MLWLLELLAEEFCPQRLEYMLKNERFWLLVEEIEQKGSYPNLCAKGIFQSLSIDLGYSANQKCW